VTSLTGEAYVNRRKGKIICGYELELKMKYEGVVDGVDVSGNVHFPYIADENVGEEPECVVLASGNAAADEKAKRTIRTHLFPKFFQAVALFEKELAAGGPGGAGDAPPVHEGGRERRSDERSIRRRHRRRPNVRVRSLGRTKSRPCLRRSTPSR
jgi:hypothetical protein